MTKTKNKTKKNYKSILFNKLSLFANGLLTVAALLTLAGIFLGFGNLIDNYVKDPSTIGYMFGKVFKSIGGIIFNILPILFVIAIVGTFTKNYMAVFAGVVAWFALLTFSSLFLFKRQDGLFYVFNSWKVMGPPWAVSSKLGIKTLDPGILWSFIVAALTVFAWNKTSTIKFPQVISFWEGERFVPFVMMIIMIPLSIIFILIWPLMGNGIEKMAKNMATWPGGLDSFFFALIDKWSLPFGLHHFVYSSFFFDSAGGSLSGLESYDVPFMKEGKTWAAGTPIYLIFNGISYNAGGHNSILNSSFAGSVFSNGNPIHGDQILVNTLQGNKFVHYDLLKNHLQKASDSISYGKAIASGSISQYTGGFSHISVNVGRYTGGWGGGIFFGYTAAAVVMVLLAKKENRKIVATLMAGAIVAVFLGISEPFTYTFLFTAPWLFFLVFCPLNGLDTMFGNLFGIHMNGQDIINTITTGVLPHAVVGQDTNWYMLFAVGGISLITYSLAFLVAIKFGKLETPGRVAGKTIGFATKEEALEKVGIKITENNSNKISKTNSKDKNKTKDEQKARLIIQILGGKSNIKKVNNCASRLRVDIIDKKKIITSKIKSTGAFGHIFVGDKHIQIIYGGTAQRYRQIIEKLL